MNKLKLLVLCLLAGTLSIIPESWGSLDATSYRATCQKDIETATALFHKLENLKGPKTIETALEPLNDLEILLGNTASKAGLFYNVHPDKGIRDVAEKHQQALVKLFTDISLSRPLYETCLAVDASQADAETQRMLKHTLRDFRRSGVDKSEEVRDRIRKLNDELVLLGQEFSINIRADVRSIILDSVDELAGLPDDYIAAHQPDENGKITITTDYPDYLPFNRFAHNDTRRLELYKAFKNRGYPKNEIILKDILIKRHELANLLGYGNYAQFVSETKMIKTAPNIRNFIDEISAIATPRADKEYAQLLKRWQKIDPEATSVGDWQKTYLQELIKQEQFDVDAKAVRKYFQFGKVRDGILELSEKLFGVEFRPWETETWDSSVESYELLDDGNVIGRFHLDLHPRENKYKHAAHFDIHAGIEGRQIAESALVCNFPGKDDETELIEHSQVETFLHEFGHLLHHLFSGGQRWASFSGIATELDFVEAPSQMLEEWVWNEDALKLIAVNKEGESLPSELLEKMTKAKEFGEGLFVTHQMFYAAMSINFYDTDPTSLDLRRKMAELQFRYSPFDYVPDTHMHANFGHLVGYSAMYCTYMWSLVISKDLFSRFEEAGMFDSSVAQEYRKAILAAGGTKDAVDLVQDFLGRPYSFEPFAQWINGETTEQGE